MSDAAAGSAEPASPPTRRRALTLGFAALAVPVIGAAGY